MTLRIEGPAADRGVSTAALPDWYADAACLGMLDADRIFFPTTLTGPAAARRYDRAKAVCTRCTVRSECLNAALAVEKDMPEYYRHGVFGGCSPGERFAMSVDRASSPVRGECDWCGAEARSPYSTASRMAYCSTRCRRDAANSRRRARDAAQRGGAA